ncbi:MAG TPA: GDSL-type esterase/lipase family protein [Phycisphaerae bacterium]|nr:GDSL-type esterase/lipase family protein [Phycisphaerae bacterium]
MHRLLPFALLPLLALTTLAQTPPTTATTAPATPDAVTLPDEHGTPRLYPTTPQSIVTPHAGILNLSAQDIPRYTQTGPLPDPPPARHFVIPPVPHNPNLPTLWTIGDSTVRTGVNGTGDDRPGQWGWGCPLVGYFDPAKVNVVNRAVGGTTSGSFYNAQWPALLPLIKKGDVVLMQFGTNSGAPETRGIGDEPQTLTGRNGQTITGHSFGWFLRQFIHDTQSKGATPIICSLIPRNSRDDAGKIKRSADSQAGWARQVAAEQHVGFIDLNELIAEKYDALPKVQVDALFAGSPHTSWTGAVLNAETVISGLKALHPDPAAAWYVPQVQQIAAAPALPDNPPATTPAH